MDALGKKTMKSGNFFARYWRPLRNYVYTIYMYMFCIDYYVVRVACFSNWCRVKFKFVIAMCYTYDDHHQ